MHALWHCARSETFCRIRSIAKPILGLLIVGIIFATANGLIKSYDLTYSLCSCSFLLATLLAVAYRFINPLGWTLVLAAMGYRTSPIASARIWLASESRRWLPGGIWGYASRALAAKELGVPPAVASGSMLLELLLTIAAALALCTLGIIGNYHLFTSLIPSQHLPHAGNWLSWGVVVLSATSLATFAAYCFRKQLALRWQSLCQRARNLNFRSLDRSTIGTAFAYLVLMAMMNGCVNLSLMPIVGDRSAVPVLAMMAATATAWIIGFLTFFSPGGVLVREAALAALLLPWLNYEAGFTLAILSRVAQLLAELICMLPLLWHRYGWRPF